MSTERDVLRHLTDATLDELFSGSETRTLLAAEGVPAALAVIAADPEIDASHRVLAHELLIDAGEPVDPALIGAYCAAVPEGFAHNWWGMPGQYLDRLGTTMVAFGPPALPALAALLDDERPLGYWGSEEPTIAEVAHYRVRDLAAYLATEILGSDYVASDDPAERDEFVERLRSELPAATD